MPRIRNWQDLHFSRPDKDSHYPHIDALFSATVDWDLIETLLPDMLRVALSVKAGLIRPSAILRRLSTYSRKNKLYFAFRELGRVVRTIFLLVMWNMADKGKGTGAPQVRGALGLPGSACSPGLRAACPRPADPARRRRARRR
jgi:hypothetical protein